MSSVPPQEAGVASGTNNALRQLGGVFGVAVLAAIFIHEGGYTSPRVFVDGFTPALWVSAGLSALGVIAALLAPAQAEQPLSALPAVPVLTESSEPAA